MANLKQSTAYTRMFFMVSSTDHIAAKTGAAPVVNISKAGAAFGAAAGVVAEIANGWYKVSLTNADTNTLGDLAFHITGTGADDCDFADTVTARSFDDLSAPGTAQTITANQDVNVKQWNGSAVAAPATAGVPKVAIEAAGDFAQAAADKVWSSAARTLTAFSTALAVSVWDVLDASIGTASSVGLRLKGLTFTTANKVDATIQAAADFAQGAADKVWLTVARSLTDKAGFALSAAGVQAIWDALTASLTTVGSIGKLIVDNLNATITSVKALLPAALVGGRIDASVGAMANGVITAPAHSVGAIDAAAVATDAVNEIRDAVINAAVDGTTTLAESLRLSNAALGGKASGLSTGSPVYRDLADTKDRITATTDADGNRTAVSRNLA